MRHLTGSCCGSCRPVRCSALHVSQATGARLCRWQPRRRERQRGPALESHLGGRGAATGGAPPGGALNGEAGWPPQSFPTYLQTGEDRRQFLGRVMRDVDRSSPLAMREREAHLWQILRAEAEQEAAVEPLLSSFLYASIVGHSTFEQSLAFVLANRLSDATMLPAHLFRIFHQVLKTDADAKDGALTDLEAHIERDPSCHALCHAFLFFKGYHAIQAHRIAHALWRRDQTVLALALQSRMSEVLTVDIHPAARIGKGILLDHGTGVVIGETAVLGDNCSLLQNVNLGGNGTDTGDRHPKIGRNVLIDASATILGNIQVGDYCQIAAGSLVMSSVPPFSKVAGTPAKVVGRVPPPEEPFEP